MRSIRRRVGEYWCREGRRSMAARRLQRVTALRALLVVAMAAVLASGSAQQLQTETRKAPWQWSQAGRAEARELYVQQKQAEDRALNPSSPEASATIIGSATPELIFPIELFGRFLHIGFHGDRESRDLIWEEMEERARVAGLTLPEGFRQAIETSGGDYLRSLVEVDGLSADAQGSSPRELARIDKQIRAQKIAQCALRADALARARHIVGHDFFDRFLYAAVAPTMFVTIIGEPVPSPLELERGCR
jgi:hypothetical protein